MKPPPLTWDGVLRRLRSELPDYALSAWIHPLHVEAKDASLTLRAPSSLHRERVRRSFLTQIRACAAAEAGAEVAVEVEVGGAPAPGPMHAAEAPTPFLRNTVSLMTTMTPLLRNNVADDDTTFKNHRRRRHI